jgi:hypothetical protein
VDKIPATALLKLALPADARSSQQPEDLQKVIENLITPFKIQTDKKGSEAIGSQQKNATNCQKTTA